MIRCFELVAVALVLVGPVRVYLVRASWTADVPHAAIVLWQAVAVATTTAVVGVCCGLLSWSLRTPSWASLAEKVGALVTGNPAQVLTPNQLFALTAGLIVVTLVTTAALGRTVGMLHSRAHHRLLIDLVGQQHSAMPGAVVVDHPRPTAYCLPGLRPRIVVSSGAIAQLSVDELAAVLAHERAHIRAHHDLVLLPFGAVASIMPRSSVLRGVNEEIRALIEMAADDCAMHRCDRGALARALCRLTAMDLPPFALAAAAVAMSRRVERALSPNGSSAPLVVASALCSLLVVALPIAVICGAIGPG